MRHQRLGFLTLSASCVGLLAVGLVAENLEWLSDLKVVIQRTPSSFPSSQIVPPIELTRGGSVLSVYTDARHLKDAEHGLLTHPREVGRNWERPATVSYFNDGDLRFASNVGLRVHGGKSRTGSPVPSFRLYFRREYGSAQFRLGTLFGGKGDPLTRLIAHNDLRLDLTGGWWHLVNPLAFDITRQVGGLAPETEPASFLLNGEPQGLYVLTEHVREPFLLSRFGHKHFEQANPTLRRRWMREVLEQSSFTMADASTWLDIESLTRWLVSVVFCATTDAFQAVMFRDETEADARWFWVSWDMDHSFMDLYRRARVPWRHDTFRTTLGQQTFESSVITRLIAEDPVYRDFLASAFLDALNYQLTPSFLDERYRHYRSIVERFGLEDDDYLDILEEFLESRPAFVRRLLVQYLDLNPLHRVHVEGPPGTVYRVNDHAVTSGFTGWYEQGTEVRVGLGTEYDNFSHWNIDGASVLFPEVWHRVRDDVVIEAEFSIPDPNSRTGLNTADMD